MTVRATTSIFEHGWPELVLTSVEPTHCVMLLLATRLALRGTEREQSTSRIACVFIVVLQLATEMQKS